jgi:DDE superfamily endonuclease
MPPLPPEMVPLLLVFESAFSRPTFARALVLLCGTLLASGRRTVSAALRAVGRADDPHFGAYHRVLSRARWSPLRLSRLLLGLVVVRLLPADQPVVLLLDETLERRRGKRIPYKGRFRDAVRSRGPHVVTCEGVQWLVLAVLVPLPWCRRPWALPVLTVPALSPATSAKLGRRHRTCIERAGTLARLARRWLPGRELVLVADGGFAAVHLGHVCRRASITFVTRCRMDVARYDPPTPQPAGKRGRKPSKGPRQTSLKDRLADAATTWVRHTLTWYGGEPAEVDLASGAALWHRAGQPPLPIRWVLVRELDDACKPFALCCTDPAACPAWVLAQYLGRWNIEVTFEELRAWLGAETQRGWCLLTTQRSTPCLFGLFSLVALSAHALHPTHLPTRAAAWYPKVEPTFADALAAVRRALWTANNSGTQPPHLDSSLSPDTFLASLMDAAAYAA